MDDNLEGFIRSSDGMAELELLPLRKIDQYMAPNCPCCNMPKRYTIALLASIGERTVTCPSKVPPK